MFSWLPTMPASRPDKYTAPREATDNRRHFSDSAIILALVAERLPLDFPHRLAVQRIRKLIQ